MNRWSFWLGIAVGTLVTWPFAAVLVIEGRRMRRWLGR